jgi:hypothetical protein
VTISPASPWLKNDLSTVGKGNHRQFVLVSPFTGLIRHEFQDHIINTLLDLIDFVGRRLEDHFSIANSIRNQINLFVLSFSLDQVSGKTLQDRH